MSIVELFNIELFAKLLCACEVSSVEYLSVAFWIVEASNMFEYCIVEWL